MPENRLPRETNPPAGSMAGIASSYRNGDYYEEIEGQNGAIRTMIYGPDGQPLITTEGRLKVDAQLTGSNVEIALIEDITVAAGATMEVATVPVKGYNQIAISARTFTGTHNFGIRVRWRTPENNDFLDNSYQDPGYASRGTAGSLRVLTNRFNTLGEIVRIYIENNESEDHSYSVRVTGYV